MRSTTLLFALAIVLVGALGVLLLRSGPGILQLLVVAVVFFLAIGAGVTLRAQH